MKKRIFSLVLVILLIVCVTLALTACGEKKEETPSDTPTPAVDSNVGTDEPEPNPDDMFLDENEFGEKEDGEITDEDLIQSYIDAVNSKDVTVIAGLLDTKGEPLDLSNISLPSNIEKYSYYTFHIIENKEELANLYQSLTDAEWNKFKEDECKIFYLDADLNGGGFTDYVIFNKDNKIVACGMIKWQ